jgi:hypothetical protein
MSWSTPPLSQYAFIAWCLVKHRDNLRSLPEDIFTVRKFNRLYFTPFFNQLSHVCSMSQKTRYCATKYIFSYFPRLYFIAYNPSNIARTYEHVRGVGIRGPFEKFMDSPYYSELELGRGAVTVSFSQYLPWQAMHFLQRSTHFWKTCCRPLNSSKFLASELPFHGWKSPEIAWVEIWIEFCVWLGKSGSADPQ